MYVVIKNGRTTLTQGISHSVWKYLDECKEYAASMCEEPGDVIQICELNPLITYQLQLNVEEEKNDIPSIDESAGNLPSEGDTTPKDDTTQEEESPNTEVTE